MAHQSQLLREAVAVFKVPETDALHTSAAVAPSHAIPEALTPKANTSLPPRSKQRFYGEAAKAVSPGIEPEQRREF